MNIEERFIEHEFTVGAGGKCFVCEKPIDGKRGRYSRTLHDFDDQFEVDPNTQVVEHFHPECILDAAPQALRDTLGEFSKTFAGRAALEGSLAARLARMDPAIIDRQLAKVSLEHDAKGRPRVRVLVLFDWLDPQVFADEDLENKPLYLASPKREYAFLQFTRRAGPWEATPDDAAAWDVYQADPAIPVLGAVVMRFTEGEGAFYAFGNVDLDEALALWRMRGLPTPVLWLNSASAKFQESLREQLTRCGYDGAKAPVLLSKKVTKESLPKLVALLDRYLPDPVVSIDRRSNKDCLLERIMELVAKDHWAAVAPLLEWFYPFESEPLVLPQAALRAITRCAQHKLTSDAALDVLGATKLPIAKEAARKRALSGLRREQPVARSKALGMLVGQRAPELTRAVIDALSTAAPSQIASLMGHLEASADKKTLARVRAQAKRTALASLAAQEHLAAKRALYTLLGDNDPELTDVVLRELVKADEAQVPPLKSYLEDSKNPRKLKQAKATLSALPKAHHARPRLEKVIERATADAQRTTSQG